MKESQQPISKRSECLKALNCLYLEVSASIADDVKKKVLDALVEADRQGETVEKIERRLEDEATLISEAIADVVIIGKQNDESIARELVGRQFLVINRKDIPTETMLKPSGKGTKYTYDLDSTVRSVLNVFDLDVSRKQTMEQRRGAMAIIESYAAFYSDKKLKDLKDWVTEGIDYTIKSDIRKQALFEIISKIDSLMDLNNGK